MAYLHRLSQRLAASCVALVVLSACGNDLTRNSPFSTIDTVSNAPRVFPPRAPVARVGWHVAPAGTSAGDGSATEPWSLAHALAGAGGRIQAGDTVWMRAGTYRGQYRTALAGTASQPIVFRGYPGERATIDGSLRVDGPDIVFWGFEIMQSNPLSLSADKVPGIETFGARTKLINLVVHDVAQQGITFWDGADNAEVYGCIVYNNGTHENLDHGTYVHNSIGTKLLADNVFFNNLAFGVHIYAGPEDAVQRNIHVIGNIAFNNGTISSRYQAKGNILVGGDVASEGMKVFDNLTYYSGTAGWSMWVGFTAASRDVEVRRNLVWGGETALMLGRWSSATVTDNRVGGPAAVVELTSSASGQWWARNQYYRPADATAWRYSGSGYPLPVWQSSTGLAAGDQAWSSPPQAPTVVVRPNKYESGRAHIAVYNWTRGASVAVDLSGVLRPGQTYEIKNVQNMYGAPVARGTYTGGSVQLPMSGVAPPPRIGRSTRTPPRTGPHFDTFVVVPTP